MTDVEMDSISLDKMQQSFLKNEAVRYKPYAERISIALAFKLLSPSNPRFNPFSVIDEMDYLEGLHIATKTKPESQFRKKPLYPFWHKHYFSAQHLITNINVRWNINNGGNKDLDNLIFDVAQQYGDDENSWPDQLVHRLIMGGFEERAERGLTGDWLIYSKYNNENYYLDLATHEEGLVDQGERMNA